MNGLLFSNDTFEAGYHAALLDAALKCDEIGHRATKPDNRFPADPWATFKSGAAKCAYEIRQMIKAQEARHR
jgi:hypothetical protein